jgi:type IV fimbrial biogenesis protein FimT
MVELMTVVSILAVILGVLAPSFSQFLAAQQAKALTYDLTSDLMLARNEALKRNVSISIARSGAGWEQGWGVVTVATNESLSRRNAVTQSVNLSGAPASITFDPNGRVSSRSPGASRSAAARTAAASSSILPGGSDRRQGSTSASDAPGALRCTQSGAP